MRTVYGILVGLFLCLAITYPVLAEELKVTINVENGDKATQVLGADVYAMVDGRLTEITVAPDNMPFRMNLKTGALRLKSFYITQRQALKKVEE